MKRAGPLGLPHTVPVMSKPIVSFDHNGKRIYPICPTCHVHHPVKTVHLWLDEKGEMMVSAGVLADLKLAGMPDLTITNGCLAPPSISLNKPRSIVERDNRAIRPLTPMKARSI